MPYIKTIHSIEKVRTILEILVSSSSDLKIPLPHEINAKKLAHLIRQGIEASIEFKDRGEPYISYAALKDKYLFRERNDRVIAELKDKPLIDASTIKELFDELVLEEITDTISVIGSLIKFKPHKVKFPNYDPLTNELSGLENWCKKNQYELKVEDGILVIEKEK